MSSSVVVVALANVLAMRNLCCAAVYSCMFLQAVVTTLHIQHTDVLVYALAQLAMLIIC
jgi:hypothetical protein